MFDIVAFSPALPVKFSPSVPEPVPVLAVIVHVVPAPLTLVIEGLVRPVLAKAKFDEVSPVTEALKVTVQLTEAPLVGFEPERTMLTAVF